MQMKKRGSFFKRNIISILIMMFIIGGAVYIFISQEITIREKQAELRSYEQLQTELEDAVALLQKDVDRLDNEETKELLARKKLNMVRPDEILYIIKFSGMSD